MIFAFAAIPLLWMFAKMTIKVLRALGPAPDDSYLRWVFVVEVGFLGYLVLMTVHTAIFGNRERLARLFPSFYLPFIVVLAILVLAAATWVYRKAGVGRADPAIKISPWKAMVLFLMACAVIGIELAFLGPILAGQ